MVWSSVPPMRETKRQFIDRTLEVWQPRTSRALTREDARQIAENATSFFRILLEWAAAEKDAARPTAETEAAASRTAGRRPE